MRTIKQLLKLLRKRLLWGFWFEGYDGLCMLISFLEVKGDISYAEKVVLVDYLSDHRPSTSLSIHNYWWKPGKIIPRWKFLNKLIREL